MVSEMSALLLSHKEILAADGAEACVPVVARADDGAVSRGGANFRLCLEVGELPQ